MGKFIQPQSLSLGKFRSKKKSYPFRLKIATHGIFPNPDLDFRNSNPKIHFWTIWAKKGFSLCSSLRTCCCFWAYSWFWFHILKLLSILMLHFTGGSESTKCLYFCFVAYTYIHIQQYTYIYIYIYIYMYVYICIYIIYMYVCLCICNILSIYLKMLHCVLRLKI